MKAWPLSLTKVRGSKIRSLRNKFKSLAKNPYRVALALAILGIGEATLLIFFGPPGTDIFAHYFYLYIFEHHGLTLWNNLWYKGTYAFVGYSVLPYVIASAIGLHLTELVGVAITLICITQIHKTFGSAKTKIATYILLILWPLVIESGDVPYVLGCAFVTAAILAYLQNRKVLFLIATVFALLSSPLAIGFLGIFTLSFLLTDPFGRCSIPIAKSNSGIDFLKSIFKKLLSYYLVVIVIEVIVVFVVSVGFPTQNFYPFFLSDFLTIVAFVLLVLYLSISPLRRWSQIGTTQRLVIVASLLYLLTAFVLMIVPTPIGANLNKISEISLPLAIVVITNTTATKRGPSSHQLGTSRKQRSLSGHKVASVVLIVLSLYWTFTEVSGPFTNLSQAYQQRSYNYWQPAVSYLRAHLDPGQRVEIVDTPTHAGAYYLPRASIPIVRGWFRQADFPDNRILYNAQLSYASYERWLRQVSANYIVLTKGPYDFSADNEAQLIDSRPSFITVVFRDKNITIYKIHRPASLITPNAQVIKLGISKLKTRNSTKGTHVLSLNYSPYLIPSAGCVSPLGAGRILWTGVKVGIDTLHFNFSWGTFLNTVENTLLGQKEITCKSS